MTHDQDPADFYTGLVAELYESLLGEPSRADDYTRFLDVNGTPALELACGSGLPMIELLERGYQVEGLDSSRDMLDRCRARAAKQGVDATLHHAPMQAFDLGRRYRSIFIAGASFTLLTNDADARSSIGCIAAHLEPGGGLLVVLERVDAAASRRLIGRFREARDERGRLVRVGLVDVHTAGDDRTLVRRLRYERVSNSGEVEAVERDWVTRCFTRDSFRAMLEAAGFERVSFVAPDGGPADPDASVYVALARMQQA